MSFSQIQLTRIPHSISEPRFATYLQSCANDRDAALALYQWNLKISAAFMVPLHILEITIRNAAASALGQVHTPNWPWNRGFIRSLPNPKDKYSPQSNLLSVAARQPTVGKVVADLNFVFWQKIFTERHDDKLWRAHIFNLFPHAPNHASFRILRKTIHDDLADIRILRNRIAHHEPIFSRNLDEDYNKMLKLISWRDQTTADWTDNIQTVTRQLTQRP